MRKAFIKRGLLVAIIIAATTVIFSCYPDYGLGVSDFDMVLTTYDKGVDFGEFSTYAMPDTVMHLKPEGITDDLPRTFDSDILNAVQQNMAAYGYSRITDTTTNVEDVDVVVLIAAVKSDWEVYSYYGGGYWGWYGYYPGYPYYPYYPYGGYSYEFSTGSVFVTLIDPNEIDLENQQVVTFWGAILNGLAESDTPAGTRSRIKAGIDQAFAQSTYLKTN